MSSFNNKKIYRGIALPLGNNSYGMAGGITTDDLNKDGTYLYRQSLNVDGLEFGMYLHPFQYLRDKGRNNAVVFTTIYLSGKVINDLGLNKDSNWKQISNRKHKEFKKKVKQFRAKEKLKKL